MSDTKAGGGLATCPQCHSEMSYRSNKRYCSDKCRQYGNRTKQNSANSPAVARRNYVLFDTARLMADRLYNLPPSERLGHMKALIDEAREGNTQLRELLSNYRLRNPSNNEKWLYARGSREYMTIAQAANAYCYRFWGTHVTNVVYDRCDEPEIGEVPQKP